MMNGHHTKMNLLNFALEHTPRRVQKAQIHEKEQREE
jgi:hypothetical protein